MKFKSTPGPWIYEGPHNFSGTLVGFVGPKGKTIFQSRHSTEDYTQEQCDADNKLIAAAPDLRDALIKLLIEVGPYDVDDGDDEYIRVVEKATGLTWSEIIDEEEDDESNN